MASWRVLGFPLRPRALKSGWLAGPRLTGMTAGQRGQLARCTRLSQAARSRQRSSQERGGRARRATANVSARPLFDDAARHLYQRQVRRTAARGWAGFRIPRR
jgi:hypothetical protein